MVAWHQSGHRNTLNSHYNVPSVFAGIDPCLSMPVDDSKTQACMSCLDTIIYACDSMTLAKFRHFACMQPNIRLSSATVLNCLQGSATIINEHGCLCTRMNSYSTPKRFVCCNRPVCVMIKECHVGCMTGCLAP